MIDLLLSALFQTVAGDPNPVEEAPQEATEQTEQQPSAENGTSSTERRRCRRELIVGTRMTRRVCTTAEEDRQAEREARDMVNRAQSMSGLQGN